MKLKTFWMTVAALALVRLALMAVVPVFEPSEARYAAISANMARSGDFVIPRFTHKLEYQSFDGKPPLVFQAGGLFCRVFGVNEFAVRLFPFLSAVLLLCILYHVVKRFSDAEAGRLAVLVCASCTAFYAAAGIAMTDMTLACCVAGSLLLYRCFLEGFAFRYAVGVSVLLGAGMIVKGPVALALFGLPVLTDAVVNRRWKGIFNWKWIAVAPLFLAVAVPWFVLAEQRNPGAVWYFFYNENFLRFVSHDYGDKYGAGREAFRGVSILWALVATLPWALLPLWNLAEKAKRPHSFALRSPSLVSSFFSLSILAIVGFWCLTSRVLIYYLFPVVPLFAAELAMSGGREGLRRLAVPCAGLSAVVLTAALVGGMFFSDCMRGPRVGFVPEGENYANEFYHGRRPEAELEYHRKERAFWQEWARIPERERPPAVKAFENFRKSLRK